MPPRPDGIGNIIFQPTKVATPTATIASPTMLKIQR
jgi:hypothetical protein